jgi:hypothetical protein
MQTPQERILLDDTPFMQVYYYPKTQILYYAWKETSEYMAHHEYQSQMLNVLGFAGEKHYPLHVIADWRASEFVVIPELQDWLNTHIIAEVVKRGMKRLFVILRDDLIQQLAIEQIIAEDKTKAFNVFYTDELEKALVWIEANPVDAFAS